MMRLLTAAALFASCASAPRLPYADPESFSVDPYFVCPNTDLDAAEARLVGAGWLIRRRTDVYLYTERRLLTSEALQRQEYNAVETISREYVQLIVARTEPVGLIRWHMVIYTSVTGEFGQSRFPFWMQNISRDLPDAARSQFNSIHWAVCGQLGFLPPSLNPEPDPAPPRPRRQESPMPPITQTPL